MASPNRQIVLPEQATRRAVIDVGTNSIKLLIADVSRGIVQPVLERSEQTRLGSGFYESHRLQPVPVRRTAESVARFAAEAADHEARSVRVIATSAARDAENPADLFAAVQKSSGLRLEIISGEQEADFAYRGVTSDPELAKTPVLIVDSGGGSTEFILGDGRKQCYRRSVPLGTVRLLERTHVSDPPTTAEWRACRQGVKDFLEKEVAPSLAPAIREINFELIRLIGTSGTATILASIHRGLPRFDRRRLEGTVLSSAQLRHHRRRLWTLPIVERKKTPGLPANRADVILTGVAIYEMVMNHFGFKRLRISTRGLRFGALLDSPAGMGR
jgi:exopolyphosphatase/guanosine-5'-triphosphate,3'-diphosphate pyrophosphatase